MLSIILVSLLTQAGPTSQTVQPTNDFHIIGKCGHAFNFKGHQVGNKIIAEFPLDARYPGRGGAQAAIDYGVERQNFPAVAKGKEWYGGNVSYKAAVGSTAERPNRVHLTFIGNQVEREAARKDLESSPGYQKLAAEMGDYLAVQDYGAENPIVKDVGLVDGGRPDIVIQTTKSGKVTYRAHKYPGADVVINEIRKADPRYNPKNDPDGNTFGLGDLNTEELAIGAAIGFVAIMALRKMSE